MYTEKHDMTLNNKISSTHLHSFFWGVRYHQNHKQEKKIMKKTELCISCHQQETYKLRKIVLSF